MTDLADWAITRAFRLSGYDKAKAAEFRNGSMVNGKAYLAAFARYIMEHEQPPVDPLLIEAREIVAQLVEAKYDDGASNAKRVREGHWDASAEVNFSLLGLKRGKEMWT